MKKLILSCIFLLFPIFITATVLEGVYLQVNSDVITYYEFETYWDLYAIFMQLGEGKVTLLTERKKLRDFMVEDLLLKQIAHDYKISIDDTEVMREITARMDFQMKQAGIRNENDFLKELKKISPKISSIKDYKRFNYYLMKKNLLQRKVLQIFGQKNMIPEPTKEEMMEVYAKEKEKHFVNDDEFVIRRLKFIISKEDSGTDKQWEIDELAENVFTSIKEGKSSIADYPRYAAIISEDDEEVITENFTEETLSELHPVFSKRIPEMKEGDVERIDFYDETTGSNYIYIVKLDNFVKGKVKTFDQARNQIYDYLTQIKSVEILDKEIAKKRLSSRIRIIERNPEE